jgi:putative oxidoreductase
MLTAIRKVHQPQGVWAAEGGWEYNAVIIATLAMLTETGPGPASLDSKLGIELSGTTWALLALAAGVGGAAANLSSAGSAPETVASPPADVR